LPRFNASRARYEAASDLRDAHSMQIACSVLERAGLIRHVGVSSGGRRACNWLFLIQ
jgi:hypothetical protein